jgi:adenylate kinase
MLALQVPDEELKKRLMKRAETSGRADDADPKIIENRIAVYKKETAPVAEYYDKQGKLAEINGLGTIEEISQRLFDAVDSHE